MKRAILVELRLNTHHTDIEETAQALVDENNFELMQISFNSLKERVVIRKFKAVSLNCYILKMLRKVFCALQENELKTKILRSKANEVVKIQESKYFWHWRQAFVKEREKNQAHEYI